MSTAYLDDSTRMVRIEGTSIDGYPIGKHLSPEKFKSCLPNGVCLAEFALAADLAGTPQLGWWADWRQPNLGDMYLRPDLGTAAPVPDEPGMLSVLGNFTSVDGTPIPVCPRTLLQRQVERLAATG